MTNTLKFTNDKYSFEGSVEFDLESQVLHGKILHINSIISYEADTLAELNEAFLEAVEDYLDMCSEMGVNPEKPYKGSFNIRTTPELHRQAALLAFKHGKSLNDFVGEAISEKVKKLQSHTMLSYPSSLELQKITANYAKLMIKTTNSTSYNQKDILIPLYDLGNGEENYAPILRN